MFSGVMILLLMLTFGNAVFADSQFQMYVRTDMPTGWLRFQDGPRLHSQRVSLNQRSIGLVRKIEVSKRTAPRIPMFLTFHLSVVSSQKFLYIRGTEVTGVDYFYADLNAGTYVRFGQQLGVHAFLEQGTVDDELRNLLQKKDMESRSFWSELDKILAQKNRRFQANSVWELAMRLPPDMRESLNRVFNTFSPDLSTEAVRRQFTALLVKVTKENRHIKQDESVVHQWIEALGDDAFAVREKAERSLLEYIRQTAFSLDHWDESQLTPEQQLRLRRISRRVGKPDIARAAEMVVARYGDDVRMWARVLESEDGEERKFALERLKELTKMDWVFDPFADDALRSKSLDEIKSRPEWKEKVQDE